MTESVEKNSHGSRPHRRLWVVSYLCTFGIHWLIKEWGDAALTEPVAVTTWLIFYRSPVFGFDPLLTWAAYLLADAWIGFRIYRSQTPWESVVLGIILGGLVGGNVGRMAEGALDYASMEVGGGRWLAVNFPDSALVLGAMLLATIWIRRLVS